MPNRTAPLPPYSAAPKWRRRRPGRLSLSRTTLAAGLPLALFGAVGLTSADSGHHGLRSPAAHSSTSVAGLSDPRLTAATSPSPQTPGAVAAFGTGEYGGPGAGLAKPLVGLAPTPSGHGYWAVAADGGVFPFGDAGYFGSLGNVTLNKPIVGIAATPTGRGYWLVAADGGVFPFGDAAFHGGLGNVTLNKPIVGIAASRTGAGYWLVAADGGVFPFGDAAFHGGLGNVTLNKPIVGATRTPSGNGYWLVAADGGVFPFGDAAFHGGLGSVTLNKPVVGIAATPTGAGYWLVAADGGVFPFGDAAFHGALAPEPAQTEVVAVAADPAGPGYWLATAPAPPPPPAGQVSATAIGPNGQSLGTFVVTCYDLSGSTATGAPVNSQTVAVDPSVIPLGSHIYVDGAGARIAEDTGGAIVGRRLDIWEPSYSDCAAWGVQSRQVWMEG